PSILYAGTGRGIVRSTNAGADWQTVVSSFAHFTALVVDPTTTSTMYAGALNVAAIFTSGSGGSVPLQKSGDVIKTTDSWLTWTNASKGLETPGVTKLVIDSLSAETLYAATSKGVFKTTNSATTWATAS